MVGVGRDLCGSSSPTLLSKQGHLQQAAEDRVQVGLEYLQRRRQENDAEGEESGCFLATSKGNVQTGNDRNCTGKHHG